MEQLFSNLKYVEFAWTGVGPMPGSYLASMGATVIRIESGTRPDPLRTMGPYKDGKPGINRSLFYNAANSNKYGFSLNMNHPKAAGVARKLIAWADVLAESYTPGTMKKWNLDYAAVKEINPDIIYYSTSMSGQTGPYARLPGFGAQLTGMSGFTMITGWPDRLPAIPYGAYTDFINIKLAIFVLMAAIDYKRRTGQGQHIDLSQFEGGVLFLAPLMLDYFVNNRVAVRSGNRDPAYAPHGVYRCKGDDQWCALAVGSNDTWLAFCRVIGNPSWCAQSRFSTHRDRKINEDELDTRVEQWTIDHTPKEVMGRMQAAGIPAGVVNRPSDTFTDPQLTERQAYRTVHHPEIGEHFAFNMTAGTHFSRIHPKVERSSPCIGEHNDYVCRDLLGMSENEMRDLAGEGVFE
ncbi:MAG: CoA transferase [Desulfobacteraceae bacterium]|nr:MAG: CoA transferase [Desulfobacteraceae bacterium]